MPTIFSKIIGGDIPSYKIAEDDHNFAFLDINPVQKGHTLVVPKMEVDKLFDLSDEAYLSLFSFAKKVSVGIKNAFPCDRVGMTVIGLEVPHAHIHLMPINSLQDMSFTKPKLVFTQSEFMAIQQAIISHL